MGIVDDKKRRRKENKKKRMSLLYEQTRLDQDHCAPCPLSFYQNPDGCKTCRVYARLQDIGNELSDLAKSSFVPPDELTWKGYLLLKDREWSDKSISSHYKIPLPALKEFIASHKEPQDTTYKEMDNMETIREFTLEDLTPEIYNDMIASGRKDKDILAQYNATYYTLSSWKTKNGISKGGRKTKKQPDETAIPPLDVESTIQPEPSKEEEKRFLDVIAQLQAEVHEKQTQINAMTKEEKRLIDESSRLKKDLEYLANQNRSLLDEFEQLKTLTESTSTTSAVQKENDELFEYILLKELVKAKEQILGKEKGIL